MEFPKDTRNGKELCLALFSEFFATLMFVYLGCLSVIASAEAAAYTPTNGGSENHVSRIMPIAMAFGMSYMVLSYAVGNLSGAQINPAISLFLCLVQEMSPLRGVLYIIAQLLGSILGSGLVLGSTSGLAYSRVELDTRTPYALGANALSLELTTGNGFLLELMGTLFIIFIFFGTAVRIGGPSDGQPNLAPLCIGFAVFVVHLVLIPLTGCGTNPARSLGPSLVDSFSGNSDGWAKNCWIYYVAPFSASILAAALYHIFNLADDLPADWDDLDVDDDGTKMESSSNSAIEVRKYRKPSSVSTTGYASLHTRKLGLIMRTSAKNRRNQQILPGESGKSSVGCSGKSSVFDIYEGQSHKFPPKIVGACVDAEEENVERDRDSHKFPSYAAAHSAAPVSKEPKDMTTDSDTVRAPKQLPSVLAPPGRIIGGSTVRIGGSVSSPADNNSANSHKFPPK